MFSTLETYADEVGVEGEGLRLAPVHLGAVHPHARAAVGAEREDGVAVGSARNRRERVGGFLGRVRAALRWRPEIAGDIDRIGPGSGARPGPLDPSGADWAG